MATQRFHITDTERDDADGIIQDREHNHIGLAWQNDAPDGHYITGQLEGYWIVSEEDYKLLKEAQKQGIKLPKLKNIVKI